MAVKVIGISGSLRKESYSTKLLKAFQKTAPRGLELEIVDISELPMFNEDIETPELKVVSEFKSKLINASAVLLVTPEYNRSFTPVIKNALDWGSRPLAKTGQRGWNTKPVAVAGVSPYSLGAFGAVNHLRQVLVYIDLIPMQQPEFYLNYAADKFDDDGNLAHETTQELVTKFWTAFAKHIKKING